MKSINKPFNPYLKEFDLIYKYFHAPAAALLSNSYKDKKISTTELGIGDDCALLDIPPNNQLAISTDTLVEGRHFFNKTDPADIAYKAFMVSVSDLAAMGANPKWLSLALTLPCLDEDWLSRFSSQLFLLLNAYDMTLVGGDTTKGPLTITMVVKGTIEKHRALRRSSAKVNDDIYVSGELGSSALGLQFISKYLNQAEFSKNELRETFLKAYKPKFHLDSDIYSKNQLGEKLNKVKINKSIGNNSYLLFNKLSDMGFIGRYHFPEARVHLGRKLNTIAHSAIDISDGLASDLSHLCYASQLSANIELEKLPLNASFNSVFKTLYPIKTQTDAYLLALTGGDDYELIFTAPKKSRNNIALLAETLKLPITCIGEMSEQSERPTISYTFNKSKLKFDALGFDHFA
ncbi:thiamine-phosphate kinase [Thorsellia kenyensis]|uniref:Thiamine-monophosphate kinase n=1 Tax=Thorsellia kenyensis TaxID=1549888 RepID=A0ABV6CB56_9GAMM